MSEFIGRQIELGLAVEAVRGTVETTVDRWIKHTSADIIARAEKVIDDSKRGVLEANEGARVVQKWFEGNLEGIVHADGIGYLLYNLYGDVNSTLVASGVYSHAFSLDQIITHPSLSIFVHDSAVNKKKYNEGMVNTLEISASVDNFVRFVANIVAKAEATSAVTPTYGTEYDFIGRDIEIKIADTEVGISGATALKVKSVNVKFDAGVIRNHVFGSYNPNANYNAKFAIEVSLTRDFIDTTFKDLWHNDSAKYVQIKIEGAADIGSGNKPSIVLLLNKAQVTDWSRAGGSDELVTEDVTLTAFFNQSDAELSTLTLVNKTASYAVGS